MDNETIIARAGELIAQRAAAGDGNYAALILEDLDGFPTASTFSIAKAEGIRWAAFCTGAGSHAAQCIARCRKASVLLNSPEYHMALTGTAEVCTDLALKQEMWYEGLARHFSGPEDPNLCVIRFTTQRFNLFVDWNEARGEI